MGEVKSVKVPLRKLMAACSAPQGMLSSIARLAQKPGIPGKFRFNASALQEKFQEQLDIMNKAKEQLIESMGVKDAEGKLTPESVDAIQKEYEAMLDAEVELVGLPLEMPLKHLDPAQLITDLKPFLTIIDIDVADEGEGPRIVVPQPVSGPRRR